MAESGKYAGVKRNFVDNAIDTGYFISIVPEAEENVFGFSHTKCYFESKKLIVFDYSHTKRPSGAKGQKYTRFIAYNVQIGQHHEKYIRFFEYNALWSPKAECIRFKHESKSRKQPGNTEQGQDDLKQNQENDNPLHKKSSNRMTDR
jgi:hypothetical protein